MPCLTDYTTYANDVIIRSFKGEFKVECLIESWDHIIDNKLIEEHTVGVISDYRKCVINFNMESLKTLNKYIYDHSHIIGEIKMAQVINTPMIIYAMLFSADNETHNIKAFSTMSAAKKWMLDK